MTRSQTIFFRLNVESHLNVTEFTVDHWPINHILLADTLYSTVNPNAMEFDFQIAKWCIQQFIHHPLNLILIGICRN